MANLLLDQPPLQLQPQLAKLLGLNEAIVTQQIHYLLQNKNSGKVINGKKWIFNTYEQWQEDWFPFWGIRTIARIFARLEEMFIVESCQPDGRKSRRKYYRLNAGMVAKLTTENVPPGPLQDEENPDHAKLASSGCRSCQLGIIDHAKLAPSCAGASNLAENTAETSSEWDFDVSSKPAPQNNTFENFWKLYPRKSGRKKASEAYPKALKKTSPEILLTALERFKRTEWARTEPRYIPHATTWLNEERWNDETTTDTRRLPESVMAVKEGRCGGGPKSVPTQRFTVDDE